MRLALPALLLLTSCTMVDQRTFERRASAPGAAERSRASLPALPLVTIRFGIDGLDWRRTVTEAVAAARVRKPDVAFDVLTAVHEGSASDQADATEVANALLYDGVAPDRVNLGLRDDPAAAPREVRIYVR